MTVSLDVNAVHIAREEDQDDFSNCWQDYAAKPRARPACASRVMVVFWPFRYVAGQVLDHVLDLEATTANRQIAVVIPELVERHRYHYFLHNQRSEVLKALLLVKGNQPIIAMNIPWYL